MDILKGEASCVENRASASSITENAKGLGALHGENDDHFRYAIGNEYFRVSEQAFQILRP
jgi:hypothetical protein